MPHLREIESKLRVGDTLLVVTQMNHRGPSEITLFEQIDVAPQGDVMILYQQGTSITLHTEHDEAWLEVSEPVFPTLVSLPGHALVANKSCPVTKPEPPDGPF